MFQRDVLYTFGSYTSRLLKDGGLILLGVQGEANHFNLLLCRTDSVCNIVWDTTFQIQDHWYRREPPFYLNQNQDITWLEQTQDTIAIVQWDKTGHFAHRTTISLPIRTHIKHLSLAQRKKGGFWLVYGTRNGTIHQTYLLQLDDHLKIIRRKAMLYYMNSVQNFGELDENRLYFVGFEKGLELMVTDMEGNIAQNYIYGTILTRCPANAFGNWTIAATRSDGKVYTTQLNSVRHFEFFVDTGRYTIRAYTPSSHWTAWETVVHSARPFQRDTAELIVRCNDTPSVNLDMGMPDSRTAHSEVLVQQNVDLHSERNEKFAAIDYTLRFGSARRDTIHWFAVQDTLSEWLDPSTIQILSSNYPYIWELVDGNVLKIDFFGKILPNQPPAFVKFRVKPKANIPKNTQIQHQVGVYLNFEPPILIHHQTLNDE